ncbi:MAG: carboxypeptidase-like regulatory domain-containing protein [Planctomycetaceae bacterium]
MKTLAVPFAALLGVLAGCSTQPSIDYGKYGLAEVSGTVTLDDQPLAGALVIFESEDNRTSSGRTDGDGRYVLMLNPSKSGILPGKKTVRISTALSESEEETALGVETIPKRYNTDSELTADVKPEETQTFHFDLTSEGEVEQPEFDMPEA